MKRIAEKKLTLASVGLIAVVGIITYLPALKIQFLDGWWYLEWAAKYPFVRYLIQFFDPANITQGYRPVQGLYVYLLYQLFGFSPDGYHWAHNLLHTANAVLLFFLIQRLGKNWRLGLTAALIYVVLPGYSLAVFWHAVVDPLAAFFYLLTILLWTRFLDAPTRLNYASVFAAYILALLSKEIAIFLPLWLFLIEWWFYGVKPNFRRLIPRYGLFILAWIPYLYQVVQVQSHGEFVGQFSFSIGPHMLGNLIPYMAALAFPWTSEYPGASAYYVWLGIVALVYVGVMIYKKSAALLFLALVALFNIAPLLGFPLDYFNTRYLYLSMTTIAIFFALGFEWLWRVAGARKLFGAIVVVLVVALVLVSSARVAVAATDLAEYTRQLRVPFRDISRQHITFPDSSALYFFYSPKTPLVDLQGLFMTRYGLNVRVSGIEDAQPLRWQDYANVFAYYFDDQDRPHEIRVDQTLATRASFALPIDFENKIQLTRYDIANPVIQRGDPLLIRLEWRALASLDQDYTVFAHVLDARGQIVAASDSAPRKGALPTTRWHVNIPVADGIVLPIPAEVPPGAYRVEMGLYSTSTQTRLALVDEHGAPFADHLIIESVQVAP